VPFDKVIILVETLTAPEVNSAAMMDTSDRVDAALLEQIDFVPRTHVAVGKEDISGKQKIPQFTEHSQFAVSLTQAP